MTEMPLPKRYETLCNSSPGASSSRSSLRHKVRTKYADIVVKLEILLQNSNFSCRPRYASKTALYRFLRILSAFSFVGV